MTKDIITDVSWNITDAEQNFDALTGLTIRKDQHITSEFLDGLKEDRLASKDRSSEFHKVASIPVVVVEKWMREGFDIYREDIKAIMKKLRDEDLTAFIATDKKV